MPDYYKVLGVEPSATQQEIRDAYKRTALKTHPDRVSATDPTRPARTRKFQEVNDAYYTLSDNQRRKDYDEARRYASSSGAYSEPEPPRGHASAEWQNEQFGNVFEEMLHEEGLAGEADASGGGRLYGIVGGISGAALGFIVGNVPGLLAGAVAGNRLGAVRDAKGKSVYEVFQQLPQDDKAKVSRVESYHMLLEASLRPRKTEMAVVVLGMVVVGLILHPDRRWFARLWKVVADAFRAR